MMTIKTGRVLEAKYGRNGAPTNRRKTGRNGKAAVCNLFQGGSQFITSSYITNGTNYAGTITVDADRHGFALDIASLNAPKYIKFCVKGTGANLTATLTPK